MCLGVPGRIVAFVDLPSQRAIADVDGVRREISVALLGADPGDGSPPVTLGDAVGDEAVGIGDWVLIHVGFAMSRIDEAEAHETLRALKRFTDAFDAEMEEFAADGELDPLQVLGPPPPPVRAGPGS